MVNRPRMGRTGPVHVKRRRREIRMRGALLDEAPPGSLAAVHRRRAVVGDFHNGLRVAANQRQESTAGILGDGSLIYNGIDGLETCP